MHFLVKQTRVCSFRTDENRLAVSKYHTQRQTDTIMTSGAGHRPTAPKWHKSDNTQKNFNSSVKRDQTVWTFNSSSFRRAADDDGGGPRRWGTMLRFSWLNPGQIVQQLKTFGPLQPAVVGITSVRHPVKRPSGAGCVFRRPPFHRAR